LKTIFNKKLKYKLSRLDGFLDELQVKR